MPQVTGLNKKFAFEIYKRKWKSIYVMEIKCTYDFLFYENKVLLKWNKYYWTEIKTLFTEINKFIFDF